MLQQIFMLKLQEVNVFKYVPPLPRWVTNEHSEKQQQKQVRFYYDGFGIMCTVSNRFMGKNKCS